MQICSSLVIVSRYSRMQEAYFYVNALPTRCLIISGIEKGIQSGLAAGTLTVALIWASWLLRYGKECTHASHSKPYCDTGLPAVAYRSADQLLLVVREVFLQRKKNPVDPWPNPIFFIIVPEITRLTQSAPRLNRYKFAEPEFDIQIRIRLSIVSIASPCCSSTTHKDTKISSRKMCTRTTRPELLWEALESRAYCRADVTKASIVLIQFLDADDGNSSRARWTGRSFFKPRMAVRA